MKIPLTEAAKKLNLNPLQFVITLAPLSSFAHVWPATEEGLVATLQQLLQEPGTGLGVHPIGGEKKASRNKKRLLVELDLGEIEVQCLKKLKSKKFWGRKAISEDALRKSYLRGSKDPGASIDKMIKHKLLLQHRQHKYALNPHTEATIEEIISE